MSADDQNDATLDTIPVIEVGEQDDYQYYDDEELVDKPQDYHERRHYKWLLKRIPIVVALGILVTVPALYLMSGTVATLVFLAAVLICSYVSLRYLAEYRLRPLRLSVSSGGLIVSQAGGKVWPWFLSSSPREIFPLDLYRPETPDLTPSERAIFRNCGTLEIKSLASEKSVMIIKDVKNPRHLVNIYEWRLDEKARREAAESRAAEQTPVLLQVLCDRIERNNELQERGNELLEGILNALSLPRPQQPRKRST